MTLRITRIDFTGQPKGNFVSFVSVVLGDLFKFYDMRLVKNPNMGGRLCLFMPQMPVITDDGVQHQYYHPVTKGARAALEDAVISEWHRRENAAIAE
jgi:DNA-binding cell septation regulator SpoVG